MRGYAADDSGTQPNAYPDLPRLIDAMNVGLASTQYAVFRKPFHIPTEWSRNEHFQRLVNLQYSTESVHNTFDKIEQLFKDLGYGSPDKDMLHDCIHHMIRDFLIKNRVPLIDKAMFSRGEAKELRRLIGRTPDLFIKGRHIVDVYTGVKAKDGKYKQ